MEKSEINPKEYSSIALAYIGDVYYELYVRDLLVKRGPKHVKKYHEEAISYVSARGQFGVYNKIKHMLSEEEQAVYRRGRNTKSKPTKNAELAHYKAATGLEALIGYLYLKDDITRIKELLGEAINIENRG